MGNSARNVSLVSKPGPAVRFLSAAVGITLALLPAAIHAADAFAPAGAKAMLSVDYIYESAGKKSSEGMYDPHEWNVKRSASLVANLGAQAATEIPTLQPIDAAQTAELEKKTAKAAQSAATQMAPMMADAEKIMARCGDDEACITREVQKMGAALQGTPQMDNAMKAKKDMEQLKPGAGRYQAWYSSAQKGTYSIDETAHISVTDPICTSKPRHRCTRDEVRKGSGQILLPPR